MSREQFIADALLASTDDCIMWPFAVRKSSGYGAHCSVRSGVKKNHDVHRYVCERAHGPSLENHQAAHRCGNKLCVNPQHLYWASPKENAGDSMKHGVLRGGGRYRQRIFEKERESIANSNASILVLAKEYGIAPTYVAKIRRDERLLRTGT